MAGATDLMACLRLPHGPLSRSIRSLGSWNTRTPPGVSTRTNSFHPKVSPLVQDEVTRSGVSIEVLRLLDHGRGDIDAPNDLESVGERLCETSDAAPEVQRIATIELHAERSHMLRDFLDLVLTRGEELVYPPPVASLVL